MRPTCRECGGTDDYWSSVKVCQHCYATMKDPYKYVSPQARRVSGPMCTRCGYSEATLGGGFGKKTHCGTCWFDDLIAGKHRSRKKTSRRRPLLLRLLG